MSRTIGGAINIKSRQGYAALYMNVLGRYGQGAFMRGVWISGEPPRVPYKFHVSDGPASIQNGRRMPLCPAFRILVRRGMGKPCLSSQASTGRCLKKYAGWWDGHKCKVGVCFKNGRGLLRLEKVA